MNHATVFRIRIKQELIAYKGNKCEICGFCKPIPRAYDFHHRDPKNKDFNISQWTKLNTKLLFKEVDKCMLVCRNCHAELHDDPDLRQSANEVHAKWLASRNREKECPKCHIKFKPRNKRKKYCYECGTRENLRKVKNRPNKYELELLIKQMSWCAIGRKYDVSDSAVRKWARQMGIKWKPYAWNGYNMKFK
jgi:hypothetical protein